MIFNNEENKVELASADMPEILKSEFKINQYRINLNSRESPWPQVIVCESIPEFRENTSFGLPSQVLVKGAVQTGSGERHGLLEFVILSKKNLTLSVCVTLLSRTLLVNPHIVPRLAGRNHTKSVSLCVSGVAIVCSWSDEEAEFQLVGGVMES